MPLVSWWFEYVPQILQLRKQEYGFDKMIAMYSDSDKMISFTLKILNGTTYREALINKKER